MKTYLVYIADAGVPVTGLSPTIDIYKKVSDNSDVAPPTVSEVGGGFYKFSVAPTEPMVVRVNANGALSPADTYYVMQISPYDVGVPLYAWQRTA